MAHDLLSGKQTLKNFAMTSSVGDDASKYAALLNVYQQQDEKFSVKLLLELEKMSKQRPIVIDQDLFNLAVERSFWNGTQLTRALKKLESMKLVQFSSSGPRLMEFPKMVYSLMLPGQAPKRSTSLSTSGAYAGVPLYPYQTAPNDEGLGLILAWPIIALIDYFSDRSSKKQANAQARTAATKAVNEAIAGGITSGDKFRNAVYLTFGWSAYGPKGQYDDGVPEVRASVVQKVRAGDPKAVAFYKAALKSGYTPPKKDPGLAQMP